MRGGDGGAGAAEAAAAEAAAGEADEELAREAEMMGELARELAGGAWEVPCVSGEQRAQLLEAARGVYDGLAGALLAAHAAVRQQERENRRQLASRGDLTDDCQRNFDRVRRRAAEPPHTPPTPPPNSPRPHTRALSPDGT